MRIKSLALTWFRGAADTVALPLNCRSTVVYGANGSGKSSFVDAIEYILCDGRVGHLAHEYSGKNQEKGVINTHRPEGRVSDIEIDFQDNSRYRIEIGEKATPGNVDGTLRAWDYRRTVLRQDEVAAFIQDTKSEKYSALLPLLGLHELEVAAENVHKIANAVARHSKLAENKAVLQDRRNDRARTFGDRDDEQIQSLMDAIMVKHLGDHLDPSKPLAPQYRDLLRHLEESAKSFAADQQLYLALQDVLRLKASKDLAELAEAAKQFSAHAEELAQERLRILESAGGYMDALGSEVSEVQCPACGTVVLVEEFSSHVKAERNRLKNALKTFQSRDKALRTAGQTLVSLRKLLERTEISAWCGSAPGIDHARRTVVEFPLDTLNRTCSQEDIAIMREALEVLEKTIETATSTAPPDVVELASDREAVVTAGNALRTQTLARRVRDADSLIAFLQTLEQSIRREIRARSESIINDISSDIQRMWAVLHPGEPVEKIRLYIPKRSDKAIDIELSFYGVAQNSPRLTLSEGHRNSLGLSIFLAMAKHSPDLASPLFLDDVVVSLDRYHRGMIVDLLKSDFRDRQIVILTHDREWYTELRHLLDSKEWQFKTLLPYSKPDVGIRWSHKVTTFDDARAHLEDRPDSAGNDARKIMDVELAIIAEQLRMRLDYRRGDRNDHRLAHEFLQGILSDGKQCFQIVDGNTHCTHQDALDKMDCADRLLLAWANRASHSFDVVRPEADKLIAACEAAILSFKCTSCSKDVWYAHVARKKLLQCECGTTRWRYGRA